MPLPSSIAGLRLDIGAKDSRPRPWQAGGGASGGAVAGRRCRSSFHPKSERATRCLLTDGGRLAVHVVGARTEHETLVDWAAVSQDLGGGGRSKQRHWLRYCSCTQRLAITTETTLRVC